MTLADLSPIANNLWQSTVFALAAWLLTILALRKNRAAVRYWVWFAASVKFLIPFSLLVSIGNEFAWHSSPTITQPQFANVINQTQSALRNFFRRIGRAANAAFVKRASGPLTRHLALRRGSRSNFLASIVPASSRD